MTEANKTRPVSGPHHCAAAGNRMRDWIFDAMLQEADKNGGSINRTQIDKLRHAFVNSENFLFNAAIDTHDFCMSSRNHGKINKFDKSTIFRFVIGAYISDLLPTIFAKQQANAHGKWKAICSFFFADLIKSGIRAEVDTEYFDLYRTIAKKTGRNFTVTDLTNDHEIYILTRAIIEQIRDVAANQNDAPSSICADFNVYLREHTKLGYTGSLFVKVRQMTALLNAALGAKTGNSFRAKVLEAKPGTEQSSTFP